MTLRTLAFDDLDTPTAYQVWRLRQDVFVVEQASPYPDLDGRDTDPATRHLLLQDAGELVGYLRVLEEAGRARIGRVVVSRGHRGRGLGARLMEAALAEIGDREVRLDAQTPLAGWYAGYGFAVDGEEFVEDGVAHLPMRRRLRP